MDSSDLFSDNFLQTNNKYLNSPLLFAKKYKRISYEKNKQMDKRDPDNIFPFIEEENKQEEAFNEIKTHNSSNDSIKRITAETLRFLINKTDPIIVDCRYEYEYNGGHIIGAININSINKIKEYLFSSIKNKPVIIHCELSSERAPKMALEIRNKDRNINREKYPFLFYENLFVLEGGYKVFFKEFPFLCTPKGYIPMNKKEYRQQLKKERKNKRKNDKKENRLKRFI